MIKPGKDRYSYADILESPDEEWVEIIDGTLCPMESPGRIHQGVFGNLLCQLRPQLKSETSKLLHSIGVRPFEKPNDKPSNVDTFVLPDITAVFEPKKFDEFGFKGAPNLVVEIISPASRYLDTVTKFDIYEKAGVQEYWIADPDDKRIKTYVLDRNAGKFRLAHEVQKHGMIELTVRKGIFVDVGEAFADEIYRL